MRARLIRIRRQAVAYRIRRQGPDRLNQTDNAYGPLIPFNHGSFSIQVAISDLVKGDAR